MVMNPDDIATIDKQIPGFSGMSPEQQDNIVMRLHLRAAAGQVQTGAQPAPDSGTTNQATAPSQPAPSNTPVMPKAPSMQQQAVAQAPMGVGLASAPTITGPVAGTILAGQSVNNQLHGKEDHSLQGKLGEAQASISSGGLTTLAKIAGLGDITSGKDKDQVGRDADRGILKQAGIYDKDYNITLLDGTKVNMGVDGSIKNYNVDFKEKGIGDIVALVNPFANLVAGGDPKRASDLAGQLANAIKTSKDPAAEVRNLFMKAGITKEQALQGISQLKLDDQTKKIFSATISQLGLKSGTTTTTTTPGSTTPSNAAGNSKLAREKMAALLRDQRKKEADANRFNSVNGIRSNMLNSMLAQNTQPLQYPKDNGHVFGTPGSTATNSPSSTFNSVLSKIIG